MSLTPAPSQRITTLFSHLKHVPAHKRTSSSASVSSVVEPSPALARQRVNIERKKRKRIQEDVDSDDLDEDDRPRTDDEDCQMEDAGAKQDGFDEPSLAAEILKPIRIVASAPAPATTSAYFFPRRASPPFTVSSVSSPISHQKTPFNHLRQDLSASLRRSDSTSSSSSLSSLEDIDPSTLPLPGALQASSSPQPSKVPTASKDKGKSKAVKADAKGVGKGKAKASVDFETYAHLKGVPDHITFENDLLLCGINPGIASATKSEHYGNPTNKFWRLLHLSGLTSTQLASSDGKKLLESNIGITNLSPRPTRSQAELSPLLDLRANVPLLLEKIKTYRPRVVCFVGKGIWKEVEFVFRKAEEARLRSTQSGEKGRKKGKKREKEDAASRADGQQWEGVRGWKMIHSDRLNAVEGSQGREDGQSMEGRAERSRDGTKLPVRETLFWVVGSTSGLVRETMDERLPTWRALKTLVDRLQTGDDEAVAQGNGMKVVDVEGVGKVVEDLIRQADT